MTKKLKKKHSPETLPTPTDSAMTTPSRLSTALSYVLPVGCMKLTHTSAALLPIRPMVMLST
jgi:hypothetical protein